MAKIQKLFLSTAVAFAGALSQTSLASDVEVNGNLRTLYFNRDFQDGNTDVVSLTQALKLSATGSLTDSINFGATFIGNAKLDGHGDDQSIGTLDEDSDSFAKLAEAYVDVSLTESTTLRAGRWITSYALFNDQDNRATEPSTQAIRLESKLGRATVYAMYSDRASAKEQAEFEQYVDANGDKYGVYFAGATGTWGNLNVTGEFGFAEDFATQGYVNASYLFDSGVSVDFHQYIADYGSAHTSSADQDSRLTNVAVRLPINDILKLTLSYQGVGGDVAYNARWGGADDPWYVTWNAVQYSDFNRKDEDSFLVRFDYTTPIEGLNVMVRYADGEFEQEGRDQDHEEGNLLLHYDVASVPGLSFRAMLAYIRVETGGEDINETRLFADYKF